jgi:hypothetical protein
MPAIAFAWQVLLRIIAFAPSQPIPAILFLSQRLRQISGDAPSLQPMPAIAFSKHLFCSTTGDVPAMRMPIPALRF